jgi:hypothetical protein
VGGVAVYDSVADRVLLLSGGFDLDARSLYPLLSWEFLPGAGRSWRQLVDFPSVSRVAPRDCAWDPDARRLWVFPWSRVGNGQSLDIGSNSRLTEVPGFMGGNGYFEAVGFDGQRNRIVVASRVRTYTADTLALFAAPIADTLRFERLEIRGEQPVGIYSSSIFWDRTRAAFVLLGPYFGEVPRQSTVYTLFADDDPRWEQAEPHPDLVAGHPVLSRGTTHPAQDPETADLYIIDPVFAPADTSLDAQLWKLQRSPDLAWRRLPSAPNVGRFGALCLDTRRRHLVYHGGYAHSVTELRTQIFDLTAGTWQTLDTPPVPELRSGYAIAYDHARDRALLFGGISFRSGYLGDLWARSSADGAWTQLFPENAPPPAQAGAFLLEDPVRSRFLLVGRPPGIGSLPEVWTLASEPSLAWQRLETTGSPPDRVDGAIMDVARDRLVSTAPCRSHSRRANGS